MLSKCDKCWRVTMNGRLIKSYNELPHIHLKNHSQNYSIIVNTLATDDVEKVGHWYNISVYNGQFAVICDGLNKIKQSPKVWNATKSFCRKNGLKFHYFTARYQLKSSDLCGYLACFFVSHCHSSTLRGLMSFKKLLNNNSIKTNEMYVLNRVKHHLSL